MKLSEFIKASIVGIVFVELLAMVVITIFALVLGEGVFALFWNGFAQSIFITFGIAMGYIYTKVEDLPEVFE